MDTVFNTLPALSIVGKTRAERRETWLKSKRAFEICLAASRARDSSGQKNLLLARGGIELQDVFFDIDGADVDNDPDSEIDCYQVAIDALDKHFDPPRHQAHERGL